MSLVPLAFPVLPAGVARVSMEPERVDYAAPEARGRGGGVQAGWPLWLASYELERLDPDSADLWRAFMARLRGRQRLFLGGNPERPFPRSYPLGFAGVERGTGGAFPGWANAWSQAIDADGNALLTMTGLPAFILLSAGDYVGFKWDAAGAPVASYHRRALTRVVAPVTANAAGAVTAVIEPPIKTNVVPVGAVAHLDRPGCLMRQIPERSNLGSVGSGSALSPSTLVAAQELWP